MIRLVICVCLVALAGCGKPAPVESSGPSVELQIEAIRADIQLLKQEIDDVRGLVKSPPAASLSNPETIRLLCKSADDRVSRVVDLDFKAGKANGFAAVFTDTTISWITIEVDSITQRNVTYDNKIDRLTGVFSRWGRGVVYSGPGPVISCAEAPPAKI